MGTVQRQLARGLANNSLLSTMVTEPMHRLFFSISGLGGINGEQLHLPCAAKLPWVPIDQHPRSHVQSQVLPVLHIRQSRVARPRGFSCGLL